MDTKRRSITQQKTRNTYQRNQRIRELFISGESQAQLGRWFRLTRQAIRKIISEASDD